MPTSSDTRDKHQPDDAARRRAERHADADFGASAADRVRRHAVQPEAREQQRERAEEAGQHRDHALLGERRVHLIRERPERQREIRIDARNRRRRRCAPAAAAIPPPPAR